MESSVIAALDLSMFSNKDILNTVLQRSEVLYDLDRPGVLIRQWTNGAPGALEAEVNARGQLLLKRAISVLYLEYLALRPTLKNISPTRLADIGCGYGFIDLFIAKEFGCDVTLIDLESNDRSHFGFQAEAAAYTSLDTAKKFLVHNGVPNDKISTLNPAKDDPGEIKNIDLALSLLSCGFHYPVSTYADFWENGVTDTGSIILDLRNAKTETQLSEMIHVGSVRALWKGSKWNRVLVQKFSN
jgi:SAM-dependent methyltransferase